MAQATPRTRKSRTKKAPEIAHVDAEKFFKAVQKKFLAKGSNPLREYFLHDFEDRNTLFEHYPPGDRFDVLSLGIVCDQARHTAQRGAYQLLFKIFNEVLVEEQKKAQAKAAKSAKATQGPTEAVTAP